MNLEQTYHQTLMFFIGKLNNKQLLELGDKILIQDEEHKAYIYYEAQQLIFTIEGLYHYLNVAKYFTYNQYRRMLYSSELNKDLSVHQVKIINHQTGAKSDIHFFSLVGM